METKGRWILLLPLLLLLLFAGGSRAAQDYNSSNQTGAKSSQPELKKLVAPIALYPDPLLAQILPASTYPLEIVDAARMIRGPKDYAKIDAQNWDPSVKAVAHYPAVLKMMSDRLDWTQELGQAVLNQQSDVLQEIQELRREAQTVGNLKSTAHQKVRRSGDFVEIVPVEPDVVYAPIYDPDLVYISPVVVGYAAPIGLSIGFGGGLWFTSFAWPSYSLVYTDAYYPWWSWRWVWPWWGWSGGWRDWRGWSGTAFHVNNVNITNFNRVRWSHDDRHGNPFNGRIGSPSEHLVSRPRGSWQNFSPGAEAAKSGRGRESPASFSAPSKHPEGFFNHESFNHPERASFRAQGAGPSHSPMFRNIPGGGSHPVMSGSSPSSPRPSMQPSQHESGMGGHGNFGGRRR